MHEVREAKITSPIISLKDNYVRLVPVALIVAAIGIGIALAFSMFADNGLQRFQFSYLASFASLMSLCMGGLFFVIVMHLTRAGWSATIRRIAEIIAMCCLPMFILYLPILIPVMLDSDAVYPWVADGYSIHGSAAVREAELARSDQLPPLELLKNAYLNKWFFAGRIVTYFTIWSLFAWFFLRNSLTS